MNIQKQAYDLEQFLVQDLQPDQIEMVQLLIKDLKANIEQIEAQFLLQLEEKFDTEDFTYHFTYSYKYDYTYEYEFN